MARFAFSSFCNQDSSSVGGHLNGVSVIDLAMLISAQKNKSRHIRFFFFFKGREGRAETSPNYDIVYDSKVKLEVRDRKLEWENCTGKCFIINWGGPQGMRLRKAQERATQFCVWAQHGVRLGCSEGADTLIETRI